MKREFLEGLELDKETIDTIMAEHGKCVQGIKEQNDALTKERDNLKTQVKDANDKIKSFEDMDIDSIKKELQDYKDKEVQREADEKKAKEEQIRNERANEFFKDVKFASESAKAGVIAQFNAKDFKYDEEAKKFQGASEWLEDLKNTDTGAFLSDVANPRFTRNPNAPTNDSSIDELREAMGLPSEEKK